MTEPASHQIPREVEKVKTNQRILLSIILLVGIALRVYFLFNYELIDAKEHVVALSDEATVGLMAKHIASGTNFPIFFYGQNYMGAFEAYVAALLFATLGASVFTLKLVPAIFSIVLLFIVYLLANRLFNSRVAILSTALVAVPSAFFFSWSLKARGGFVEHVILALLILLVFALIYFDRKSSLWLYALLGFLSGFALWVNQLIFPYLVMLGLWLWLKRAMLLSKAKVLVLLLPFLLGASPLIAGNVHEPFGTVKILARKINGTSSVLHDESTTTKGIKVLWARLKEFPFGTGRSLSILFGKGETWIGESEIPETTRIENLPEVRWLFWLIPLVFALPLLAPCYQKLKIRLPSARLKFSGTKDAAKVNLLVLLFLVTMLAYFSPSYLLVCYPLAAILAADFLDKLRGMYVKAFYTALLVATLCLNAYGIVDLALNRRDGSIAKLINALEGKGCSYGYSSGPMYQIAFYSLERNVLVPLDSKNRYHPHAVQVGKAPNLCYVFRPDQERKLDHRAFLRMLEQENIHYQQTTVNSDTVYHIYYSLAPREKIPPNVREKLKLIRKDLRSADVPRQIGLSGAVQKALSVDKISNWA
jgi:4-amino-4-deoxy-L-arabinose transferase-like glycosyltransferase